MRTAHLACCSVPFAPGRGRGCGTSPRLTARCDEREAMELEHVERILSRSTHPQCTGRRSRRMHASDAVLACPPSTHLHRTVRRLRHSCFLRPVAVSLAGKPSPDPEVRLAACTLGKRARAMVCERLARQGGGSVSGRTGVALGSAWWEIQIPRVGCRRRRR
ncbi:hypothetical protein B0H13DRAFT_2005927, partial [Mycena leptocephala]